MTFTEGAIGPAASTRPARWCSVLPATRALALGMIVFASIVTGVAVADEPGPAPAELDPIVVVATRQPGEVWDVAAVVTVIGGDTAQDELANDLKDLIRYQPGISFDGGGTRFGGAGFRIRGLGGNRVLTLVDGIPVAERFSVGSYADSGRDYAELGMVRQVEVLRGPASNLYGSKAVGGVVAIETISPSDLLGANAVGGRVQTGYASDRDQFGATAASAWRLPGADIMLAATHRQGHARESADADQLDPQDWRRQSLLAKSSLDTGLGTLDLLFDYGRDTRDTELRAILGSGRFANTTALAADDTQDSWRVGAELEQAGMGEGRLLWRAYATRAWLNQDSDEFRTLADPPVRQQREFELSQRAIGLGLDGRQPFDWLRGEQALGYGVEVSAGRLQEGRNALQTNLDDGPYTNELLGETFPRRDFPITDTLELGSYVYGELRPPGTGLTLLPGLRYDHYRLESRSDQRFEQGSPNVQLTDLHSDAWTPRLGLLYPLSPQFRGFAQYARGFRAPPAYDVNLGLDIVSVNAQALPNPDLKPERSDALELGLRYRGARTRGELSVFETQYRDFIVSNSFIGIDPQSGTRLFQSRNVERARIRGLEVRLRHDLKLDVGGAASWSAELAAMWLRGENRDTDQALTSIDPAQVVLALDRETDRTALRLRYTATDQQTRVDDAQSPMFEAPGYTVVDLIGEFRPRPQWVLRAGLFNLLDRHYWDWGDVYGRAESDPTLPQLARAGRNVSVSVGATF